MKKPTVDVVMQPKPDGSLVIHIYGRPDDALMCYNVESLPPYIRYALTCRVEYRFSIANMPGEFGCVMKIPRDEANSIFQSYG
jgi:hypothetical protein